MKRTLSAFAAIAIAAAAFVVLAPFAGARTTATTVHVQARDTLKFVLDKKSGKLASNTPATADGDTEEGQALLQVHRAGPRGCRHEGRLYVDLISSDVISSGWDSPPSILQAASSSVSRDRIR